MAEADSGQVFASVWDALEDSPAEAAVMRLRSELMIAVQEVVAGWELTQDQVARRLDVTRPRLNDLLRGRVSKFSLDAPDRASGSFRAECPRADRAHRSLANQPLRHSPGTKRR
jgi:predicted XRE-type DNA-binding protein